MNRAVLLVNLGSPDSPAVRDVRRYLNQFLMDRRVLDVPWLLRRLLVGLIVLRRASESAAAYRKIWTPDGSPLVAIGRRVQRLLEEQVGRPVQLAMRYQHPSVEAAVQDLVRRGIQRVHLIPLFPHYAMSSYETAVERVKAVIARRAPGLALSIEPPYFAAPGYLAALAGSAEPYLKQGFDHLLFSFHGLPERHIRRSDPSGQHCLRVPDCCQVPAVAHRFCYRHQCLRTAEAFAKLVGIPADRWSVAFQSRLGRGAWLSPHTDRELVRLAGAGVRRLLVICPAFVADCLETLEEIGLRGRDRFLEAGGREFVQIPCLNDHSLWIRALACMVEQADAASAAAGQPHSAEAAPA